MMPNGLKFHFSNPKFDDLPWPASRKSGKKKLRCCKKACSRRDAQKECADLRSSDTRCDWFYLFCSECSGFHVCRSKSVSATFNIRKLRFDGVEEDPTAERVARSHPDAQGGRIAVLPTRNIFDVFALL